MAKIVLSSDAPEGTKLAAVFGGVGFDAGKAKSFETTDPLLIDEAQRHPFFEVEDIGDDGLTAAQRKEIVESETLVQRAREQYNKDLEGAAPWDNRPVPPTTPELAAAYLGESTPEASAEAVAKAEESKSDTASGGTE